MPRKVKLEELGRKDVAAFRQSPKYPFVLVLDNIRSAYNVGSLFRIADAFLVEKIYLCGYTPTPSQDASIEKTALRATHSVSWSHEANIADCLMTLKYEGYYIYALEQTDQSVAISSLTKATTTKFALICGNEVHGVSQTGVDEADQCIEIPQEGTKHSLNVSVATGIAIWQLYQTYFKG